MEHNAQVAEALLANATSSKDKLVHAINAAELYMGAIKETTSKVHASRLRRRCNQLIALAEQLKLAAQAPSLISEPSSTSSLLKVNQASGSTAQSDILIGSSLVNGHFFPPWEGPPLKSEFELKPQGVAFVDTAAFTLSAIQRENLLSWSRPGEAFRQYLSPSLGLEENFMCTSVDCDLVQDVTTDCSVVASLSAAVKILANTPRMALSSIIFPYDHDSGQPKLSSSGKYIFRLYFNGCARKVVVDDRLPVSKTERTMFVIDRHQPSLLWPALLEKAYLKVRGGYDFPGSNSGTDLWVLTGWIPEQILLQKEDFDLEETWSRIKTAHDSQDVVITLGTGRISDEEERTMGLAGEHDYAVQALRERNGSRQFLVKNPWCNGPVWKVAGWSSSPTSDDIDPLAAVKHPQTALARKGCVWVSFEDVAQSFESMYLNWNPQLFSHRHDTHFIWDIPRGCHATSLARHPQFAFTCRTKNSIWILISRHFSDAENDVSERAVDSTATVSHQTGFMSILLYNNEGNRVQLATDDLLRGPYVDSLQTMAKFEPRPGIAYTVVLDQHGLSLPRYSFSLSIFSQEPVRVQDAPERLPRVREVSGSWTRKTAGGSAGCTTYFKNPQYSLVVPQPAPISLMLSTDARDTYVHVDLIWANGKRVTSVRARDIAASSGEYRRGCAVADAAYIEAGVYTAVCSTFEPDQNASFCFRASSTVPIDVQPIPNDSAGMLRTPLTPFYLSEGEECRRAALSVSRLTKASAGIRGMVTNGTILTNRSTPAIMIRVSVVQGRGPDRTVLAVTGDGDFQESTAALRTPEFDLDPERMHRGGFWLLVESLGTQDEARAIEGDIYAESVVEVGAWEVLP